MPEVEGFFLWVSFLDVANAVLVIGGVAALDGVATANMLLLSVADRVYIVMYQGLAEGAQLHLHLLGLALPPVRDHRQQQEDRALALL